MQEIYTDNIKEILRNKKLIEKELKIKLFNKGKNLFIEGDANLEYMALEFFKAVNLGFSVEKSLKLNEEGITLQILNIKDITKRNDLERIKARIIGKRGKTLKTLHNLTKCDISLKGNIIGIIGDEEEIEDATNSFKSLIQGSRHGKVYSRLESQRKKKRLYDNFNIKSIN